MRISFYWDSEPLSEKVCGEMSVFAGIPLRAVVYGNSPIQGIAFDSQTLSELEFLTGVRPEPPKESAARLARRIESELRHRYGIVPRIWIDDMGVLEYAARVEERFTQVVKDAVADLKATRSWFKDHRFAEIRRRLETILPK